jgi:hypothetical protein
MFLRSNRRFKGRQGAPRLEYRREPALCQRQGGAAAGALGEIGDGQHDDWSRAIEAFDEDAQRHTPAVFFPPIVSFPDSPRGTAYSCDSMRWSCIGRGSGARAGFRVNSMNSLGLTSSGRAACGPRARKCGNADLARIESYRCICMIWSIGIMLWLRCAMIQSDPAISRMTIRTPKASASTLLVLSAPVVMCRKNTRCTPI